MKMLVKIAAVLAFCFILVEGRAHSSALLKQLKLLRDRELRTYGGHTSIFGGSSMLKRLPWADWDDSETEADGEEDSETQADGEDDSETVADEQNSEVGAEQNDDTEGDASQDNSYVEDIARKLEKALMNRKFYKVFYNDRRDTSVTTPETEKSDDKSSSEGESEEIKRGLVKLARKINKMLGQRDTSGDDEETDADDQESSGGETDDTGDADQESSAGETDDNGASDEESSDGEVEEIERELLKKLLSRRLH